MVFDLPGIRRRTDLQGWWRNVEAVRVYIEYCEFINTTFGAYPELAYVAEEHRKLYGVRALLMLVQARSFGMVELPLFLRNWIRNNGGYFTLHLPVKILFMLPNAFATLIYQFALAALQRR